MSVVVIVYNARSLCILILDTYIIDKNKTISSRQIYIKHPFHLTGCNLLLLAKCLVYVKGLIETKPVVIHITHSFIHLEPLVFIHGMSGNGDTPVFLIRHHTDSHGEAEDRTSVVISIGEA